MVDERRRRAAGQGETREALLRRVRAALGATSSEKDVPSAPDAPAVDESLVRLCTAADDVVSRFAEQARAVGMQVQRSAADGAVQALADVLRSASARSVVVDAASADIAHAARAAIEAAGCRHIDASSNASRAARFAADAAITDVDAAIADTGSLVLASGPQRSRACHLLPRLHIAIVGAGQILPDLIDFWQARPLEREAAATVLITGPSKTADIEGVLITGVHGPGAVCILIVDEENAS